MPDPRDFLTVLRPDRMAMMQQPTGPSGLAGLLARPGMNEGLLSFGLNMLASDQKRETFGQSLLRSVGAGAQAYEEKKADAEYNTILNDPAIPEQMRGVLKAIGRREGWPLIAQSLAPQVPELINVPAGGAVLDPATRRPVYTNTAPAEPATTPDLIEYDRAVAEGYDGSFVEFMNAIRPPQAGPTINNNIGQAAGPINEGLDKDIVEQFTADYDSAQGNVSRIAAIDDVVRIVEDPAFKAGPLVGSPIGQIFQQVTDPQAAVLSQSFRAAIGNLTMEKLREFTGPKSNFEYRMAERMVSGDLNLTPDQIRAGLTVIRQLAAQDAARWANDLLSVSPSSYDPQKAQRQLNLANQIIRDYGAVRGPLTPDELERNFQQSLGPRPPGA